MNNKFNAQTLVTIVAVLIIMAIAFTDKFDISVILPILGGFCILHAIFGLLRVRSGAAGGSNSFARCILQIVLGGFIFMLGIFDLTGVTLSQNFWNAVLIVIVVIALLWVLIRRNDIFKNH